MIRLLGVVQQLLQHQHVRPRQVRVDEACRVHPTCCKKNDDDRSESDDVVESTMSLVIFMGEQRNVNRQP